MSIGTRSTLLGIADEPFPAGTHMCCLFNDDEDARTAIARFVESGLASGERVTCLVDTMSAADFLADLERRGSVRSTDSGQRLLVGSAHETYCPDGTFVPERMLDVVRRTCSSSLEDGFVGARGAGEMTWALRGSPGSERLIEYEARINTIVSDFPVSILCQYDARRFDGATLFDVLNVHPMMVVRGRVVRNPYYVPPKDLARESRVASRSAT